jgi:WD40 repeat protein
MELCHMFTCALFLAAGEPGEPAFEKEVILLKDNPVPVINVLVTTDNKFLFALDQAHYLHLWDLSSGIKRSLGIHGPEWLAVTADGKFIFSGGTLRRSVYLGNRVLKGVPGVPGGMQTEARALWATNVHDGKLFAETLAFPDGHRFPITGATFSADGSLLVTVTGKRGGPGEVKMWEVPLGKKLANVYEQLRKHNPQDDWPDVLSGKERLPPIEYKAAAFLDTSDKKDIPPETPGVEYVALSPDGATLAIACKSAKIADLGSGTLRVWSTSTGKAKADLVVPNQPIYFLVFTRDDKTLVVGVGKKDQGEVWLWDFNGNKVIAVLRGHKDSVRALAISQDGRILASGSSDGTVKLWNLYKKREILSRKLAGQPDPINALAFSADGRKLVIGGGDRSGWIKSWELKSDAKR